MSIAIYLRVSKGRGQDTASQRPDLERWAAAQAEPATWFEDKLSGKTMERPAFAKLMAAVHTGQFHTIAVWRLDRLGRTAKGLTALFEDLQTRKVNLVSIRDGIDLDTPAGRMMANVLASVAQYETEVRAERILAGIEVARAAGKHLGRPVGAGKGRRSKVNADQEAAIHRLKAEGTPVAAIARATGLSRPTIYSVLATAVPGKGAQPEGQAS